MVYPGANSIMGQRRWRGPAARLPRYGDGAGAIVPRLLGHPRPYRARPIHQVSRTIGMGGRPRLMARLNQRLAPRFARQQQRAALHVRNARLRRNR